MIFRKTILLCDACNELGGTGAKRKSDVFSSRNNSISCLATDKKHAFISFPQRLSKHRIATTYLEPRSIVSSKSLPICSDVSSETKMAGAKVGFQSNRHLALAFIPVNFRPYRMRREKLTQ